MKFSVILSFYDKDSDIEKTYDYLIRQVGTTCELEIIIVNSCEDNSAKERLGKLESALPDNILLVNCSESATKCNLLNAGLTYVSGDYILFVRVGDILNIKLIGTLEKISQNTEPDIISFSCTKAHFEFDMFDDDPFDEHGFIAKNLEKESLIKSYVTNKDISECYFCHAYRKEFIELTGAEFKDEASDEDMVFSYPLLYRAGKVAYTKDHGYCILSKGNQEDIQKRIANRLVSQVNLFQELKDDRYISELYKEEIDYHFISEYYIKNLKLARNTALEEGINLATFEIMQYVCLNLVPKWIENDYIYGLNRDELKLMKLLYRKFESEDELYKELRKDKLVSVVTTTHNRRELLKKSIECILWQTYQNIEYIIVDDCSDDDTRELVEAIDDKRIAYVRNSKNMGVSYSRNQGIIHSNGNYIVYQDDDDFCRLDKVEKEADRLFGLSEEYGIVYCESINHTRRIDGITDLPAIIIPERNKAKVKKEGYIFPALLPKNFITSTAAMFRRKVFEELGGYDENLFAYEDWEVLLKITRDYLAGFIEEPLYDYYQRNNSLISSKDADHRQKIIQSLYHIDKKYEEDRKQFGIETSFKITHNS